MNEQYVRFKIILSYTDYLDQFSERYGGGKFGDNGEMMGKLNSITYSQFNFLLEEDPNYFIPIFESLEYTIVKKYDLLKSLHDVLNLIERGHELVTYNDFTNRIKSKIRDVKIESIENEETES